MPILDADEIAPSITLAYRAEPTPEPSPAAFSTPEVIKSAFRTENTIGSALTGGSIGRRPIDASFNPFEDIAGYEEYADSFVEDNTPDDVARTKVKIDQERQDKQLIQDAGWVGTAASFAAGVFDPVNLVPVGGTALKAYSRGGNILHGALNTARAGLVGSTVAEAALQATQETRTMGESAANIAGATFLSGVLGGAAGYLGGRGINELGARIEQEMNIPEPNSPDLAEPNSIVISTVGAKAARDTTIKQETLLGALGVEKAFSGLNPKLRLATSSSVEARRFAQDLVETPFYYEKNKEGISNPIAVETIVNMQDARIGSAIEQQKRLYIAYKKRPKVEGEVNLTYQQFREEAGRATRRNDTHTVPEVQSLARVYRKEILDPFKKAAIDVKLLPEDVKVKTAASYLHRWWDKEKVIAKRKQLQAIIHDGLRGLPEIQTKDGSALTDDELHEIAHDIIDNILGHVDTRIPYDIPLAGRGPLKERTLNFIQDAEVEDFLVNDIEAVARKYTRTMAADVAIKERFHDMNIIGKDGVITQKINEDYRRLISEAKTEKEAKALEKERKRNIRDVDALVNQIRGTYGVPEDPDSTIVRVARSTRNLQYISKLGGMTVSAFSDVARPVMVHGIMRTFQDGIVPLITNLKGLKLSAREVKECGAAWDMVLDSRAMTLAELNDPYVKGTKFEKGLQSLTQGFGKVTLMTQWNTALKQFSGVITQGRIVRALGSENISPKDSRYLAMIGIDASMGKKINLQIAEHGDEVDGVTVVNTARWTDPEAQRAYRAALKKEVDRIIVTPGAGDLPLILRKTEAGKMVGQFRSFSFAATNKMLISGLQEADASTMNGWALAVGMGMVSYAFKTWERGEELSDDPRAWIFEGVDRSGLLGILSEVNQMSHKLTRGSISLQRLAGAPALTRYASTNVAGVLAGPTIGTIQDVAQVIGTGASVAMGTTGASGEKTEWTKSDSRAMRRVIPYQNLVFVRRIFDSAEEGINEALGVRK